MAVVRCAGNRLPLCSDPCPSCGSCSTPCGCSRNSIGGTNNGGGGTNNGGNGTNNGNGGSMPFIFAPMQAPAPIIINSPAPAQQQPCQQPIIVFAPSNGSMPLPADTTKLPANNQPSSNPNTTGQTMPTPSVGGAIVPNTTVPNTTTTPSGQTTLPTDFPTNQVPNTPAPVGTPVTTPQGSGVLVPSPEPSTTMPLPATNTNQPKALSSGTNGADSGNADGTPNTVNGQPIIININNSQDRDSNNKSVYSPDISESYNQDGMQQPMSASNVVRVLPARRLPARRVKILRQTPVSESASEQHAANANNSQKIHHYVEWS